MVEDKGSKCSPLVDLSKFTSNKKYLVKLQSQSTIKFIAIFCPKFNYVGPKKNQGGHKIYFKEKKNNFFLNLYIIIIFFSSQGGHIAFIATFFKHHYRSCILQILVWLCDYFGLNVKLPLVPSKESQQTSPNRTKEICLASCRE